MKNLFFCEFDSSFFWRRTEYKFKVVSELNKSIMDIFPCIFNFSSISLFLLSNNLEFLSLVKVIDSDILSTSNSSFILKGYSYIIEFLLSFGSPIKL